ncbi:D-alanyl-D-alanine carboxypeptidase family protein [Amycolatopsis xylanica]|nr:D-alanyl-D-alanine carboxypeptidase family protein [Amycolatopsis xylanica]
MHSAVTRSLKVLVPAVMSLLLTASPVLAAPPSTTANAPASGCSNRETPPPPIDTSEKPLPGKQAPAPLPVPATPQGGPRMAECDTVVPKNALNPPDVTSASWVLQDLDTGAVLAAKNPHARQRPASLIKTLLALVVVTELKPEQVISPTKEDAEQECTCVGIVAGGKYTVDQLLHGLLMHSGNDVAHTFATALGGVDATLGKMNALAAKIGATDTRAASPSGLDAAGMSTSAYDLSVVFHYAMKQPEFAKAVGTKEFQWPAMGDKPSFPVYNDNKLLGVYPGFLGGKTGFTDDARHTYVGGAARNGKRIAVVTMRGEQRPTRIVDQASKLLDYGFALEASKAEPVGQIVYKAGTNGKAIPDPQDNSTPNAAVAAPEDRFGVVGWILTLVVALIIVAGFTIGHFRRKAAAQGS